MRHRLVLVVLVRGRVGDRREIDADVTVMNSEALAQDIDRYAEDG